jgi:hypothetical protein
MMWGLPRNVLLPCIVVVLTSLLLSGSSYSQESSHESELRLNKVLKAAGYLCRDECGDESKKYDRRSKDYDKKQDELDKAVDGGASRQEVDSIEQELVEARVRLEKSRMDYISCLEKCMERSPDEVKDEPPLEKPSSTAFAQTGVLLPAKPRAGGILRPRSFLSSRPTS